MKFRDGIPFKQPNIGVAEIRILLYIFQSYERKKYNIDLGFAKV